METLKEHGLNTDNSSQEIDEINTEDATIAAAETARIESEHTSETTRIIAEETVIKGTPLEENNSKALSQVMSKVKQRTNRRL